MKQWLLNKLLAHLLVGVNPDDVFRVVKTEGGSIIKLGNEQISNMELASLQEEIKFIEKTRFWKIITETLKNDAMERGFTKSQSFDDMRACKMMLFNLDIIDKIKDNIKKKKIHN